MALRRTVTQIGRVAKNSRTTQKIFDLFHSDFHSYADVVYGGDAGKLFSGKSGRYEVSPVGFFTGPKVEEEATRDNIEKHVASPLYFSATSEHHIAEQYAKNRGYSCNSDDAPASTKDDDREVLARAVQQYKCPGLMLGGYHHPETDAKPPANPYILHINSKLTTPGVNVPATLPKADPHDRETTFSHINFFAVDCFENPENKEIIPNMFSLGNTDEKHMPRVKSFVNRAQDLLFLICKTGDSALSENEKLEKTAEYLKELREIYKIVKRKDLFIEKIPPKLRKVLKMNAETVVDYLKQKSFYDLLNIPDAHRLTKRLIGG